MHDGIVEQIGTPLELCDRPGNLFVAQFIGSPAMNVFKGTAQGSAALQALGASWPLPPGISVGAGGRGLHYGIRPTDLRIANGSAAGIPARVVVVEPTGAETELLVDVGGQRLVVVMHGRTAARPDDTVQLQVDAAKAHVFDAEGGRRL